MADPVKLTKDPDSRQLASGILEGAKLPYSSYGRHLRDILHTTRETTKGEIKLSKPDLWETFANLPKQIKSEKKKQTHEVLTDRLFTGYQEYKLIQALGPSLEKLDQIRGALDYAQYQQNINYKEYDLRRNMASKRPDELTLGDQKLFSEYPYWKQQYEEGRQRIESLMTQYHQLLDEIDNGSYRQTLENPYTALLEQKRHIDQQQWEENRRYLYGGSALDRPTVEDLANKYGGTVPPIATSKTQEKRKKQTLDEMFSTMPEPEANALAEEIAKQTGLSSLDADIKNAKAPESPEEYNTRRAQMEIVSHLKKYVSILYLLSASKEQLARYEDVLAAYETDNEPADEDVQKRYNTLVKRVQAGVVVAHRKGPKAPILLFPQIRF